jgi:hypothetical protein
MAESARTPRFSRGSRVLDYWLVHAEGLTVQPTGAVVEKVVTGPTGRAEVLIVRSRTTRRRKDIPAASIAAFEPSSRRLLLDPPARLIDLRIPRPSPARIAATRATTARAGVSARAYVAGAAHAVRSGTRSGVEWLRPRAVQGGAMIAQSSRVVAARAAARAHWLAARTAAGAHWLAPRVVATSRTVGAAVARWTLAATAFLARGTARGAHGLEHAAASAGRRGRASLEARRIERHRARHD